MNEIQRMEENLRKIGTRCGLCNGMPIKRNQVFPEERVPFAPIKKSFNKKLVDEQKSKPHKCCRYCC